MVLAWWISLSLSLSFRFFSCTTKLLPSFTRENQTHVSFIHSLIHSLKINLIFVTHYCTEYFASDLIKENKQTNKRNKQCDGLRPPRAAPTKQGRSWNLSTARLTDAHRHSRMKLGNVFMAFPLPLHSHAAEQPIARYPTVMESLSFRTQSYIVGSPPSCWIWRWVSIRSASAPLTCCPVQLWCSLSLSLLTFHYTMTLRRRKNVRRGATISRWTLCVYQCVAIAAIRFQLQFQYSIFQYIF